MNKYQSLCNLRDTGHNVFEFTVCDSFESLLSYSEQNNKFTIRFDSVESSTDLPFCIIDTSEVTYSQLKAIAYLADRTGCSMVCANGLKFDPFQICNFVYSVKDNEFILELNFDKIPLRQMYNDNLITVKGNILQSYTEFIITGKNKRYISQTFIENILSAMLRESQVNDCYECTLYPFNVGLLKQPIIFWQHIK